MRCAKHDAEVGIERPGGADTDRDETCGIDPGGVEGLLDHGDDRAAERLCALRERRLRLRARKDLPPRRDDAREDLRSAEIDADVRTACDDSLLAQYTERVLPLVPALLAISLSTSPATSADAFEAARKTAQSNAKSSSGKRYQPLFAKAFSQSQTRELGRCVEVQASPDLTAFEALVRIATSGFVEEVEVRPATNIAVCLKASIRKARFPRPPRDHYWSSTTLRLSN
jgi:hypothetical protein